MSKVCFHCMRIMVILFNLLFVLIGCAILGCAIFFYVDSTIKSIKDNMQEKKLLVDIMLFTAIGIGGVTIIVSTFGCCGAYHESECLLGTYFFLLFVIVAAEVAAGVVCFLKVDEETAKETFSKALKMSIDSYMESGSDEPAPETLKRLQKVLQCCGANGYQDYLGGAVFSPTTAKGKKALEACSISDQGGPIEAIVSKFMPGCTEKVFQLWKDSRILILAVCLCVAGIELLSMIFAISLCCTVRRMESGYIGVST